jgi:transcriptional regulator GlxA family with amidase domain
LPQPIIPAFEHVSVAPRLARGGLRPQTLRRVHEYVEAHLGQRITLGVLATTAGLSVFHFTRAFKQSQGLTPHAYLLRRRIERAQQLLVETDLPMSSIAFATGFCSQSHFARCFRELVGEPPTVFRWSRR